MENKLPYPDGGIRKYDGYLGESLFGEELRDYEENHPYIGPLDSMPIVPSSKTLSELKEELGI